MGKRFFEKDLAKVVFTEIEDTLDEEGVSTIDSEYVSTEFSENMDQVASKDSSKRVVNEKEFDVASSVKEVTRSKRAKRKVKISSKDKRTRQIFENLMSPKKL